MIDRVRRAMTRQRQRTGSVRQPAADWRVTIRRRLIAGGVGLALWVGGIQTRLLYLQVVAHGYFVERAERQQQEEQPIPAKRGDILDRRGRVLATSAEADTIFAVPSDIKDPPAAVAVLCKALRCTARERTDWLERFGGKKQFAYVRRRVTPEEAARVADLKLPYIHFMQESRRWYPNAELAAHVLGYVGDQNQGLNGIEYAYDSQIRGTDGRILIHIDALRRAFNRIERPPTEGASVELTLDQTLQYVAERELRAGIEEHEALGGSVVIMDPWTGEILAMANQPTFNPNRFQDYTQNDWRNRAVQNTYEPGSTFKVVTASAAIEENVMPIDALIDTGPGIIRIGNSVVDEYDHHNYGVLSFADVLIKSSNVGAIKIGFKIGTERLGRFVARFGFGQRVAPSDFPAENPGIVWSPDKWTERALASVAMGYQVAVTPLQLAAAFGAVANGGEFIEPRVVRAVYRDGKRNVVTPNVVRRTISPDTAATLTTIMEGVVERGTAKLAQIDGYTIAGKTGTASKLIDGRYHPWKNHVSFAGFLPSRNPRVVVVVVIDEPHKGGRSGGVIAAPIFRRIAEQTVRHLGIPPTINPPTPVLVARERTPAPEPAATAGTSPVLRLVADGSTGIMPDLRGLSARDASRLLAKLGVTPRVTGDGFVVAQEPQPGTVLEPGGVCQLILDRAAVRAAAGTAQP